MASIKRERREARESALSLLYSGDITESNLDEVIEQGCYPDDLVMSEYAEMLVLGTIERRREIDERLAAVSENWALDRMPVVDRAILRLALYEMFYVEEVPVSVTINEAVELAKAYGGEDESSRFVNGVLGRVARGMEGEASDGDAEAGEAATELADVEVAEGEAANEQ